ncbi:hypothetical protein PSACC_00963 [Paramicrosporidium saccamoebae]|uniref:Uncharacterized protein n=1 Tax=Paramicrosporidium saccamoebae TaxID=1246581 RepID=A0A2H9TNC4_9FUNG|nr:hypothetical protein PSACC_00963 [Paramicrosporidium saccamoebae]
MLEQLLVSCVPIHRVSFEKVSSYNVEFPNICHMLGMDDEISYSHSRFHSRSPSRPCSRPQHTALILELVLCHSVSDFSSLQYLRLQNPVPSFPKYAKCPLLPSPEMLCCRLKKSKFRYVHYAVPKFPKTIGRPRYPKAAPEGFCSEAKLDMPLEQSTIVAPVQETPPPKKDFQILLNRNALKYTQLLGILDSMSVPMIEREFSESIPIILVSAQCCIVIVTSTSYCDSNSLCQLPCSNVVIMVVGRIAQWEAIAIAKARQPTLRLFACNTWTAIATLISEIAPPLGTFRLNPELTSYERFIVYSKKWNYWQAQEALDNSADILDFE